MSADVVVSGPGCEGRRMPSRGAGVSLAQTLASGLATDGAFYVRTVEGRPLARVERRGGSVFTVALPDLIGPERSEGPYVAPLTHTEDELAVAFGGPSQAEPGHTSCKSGVFRSVKVVAESLTRGLGAAGRGYEGGRTT